MRLSKTSIRWRRFLLAQSKFSRIDCKLFLVILLTGQIKFGSFYFMFGGIRHGRSIVFWALTRFPPALNNSLKINNGPNLQMNLLLHPLHDIINGFSSGLVEISDLFGFAVLVLLYFLTDHFDWNITVPVLADRIHVRIFGICCTWKAVYLYCKEMVASWILFFVCLRRYFHN